MIKKLLTLLVFVSLIALLPFQANADDIPDWNAINGEKKDIVYESESHMPVYRYDPISYGSAMVGFEIPQGEISIYIDNGSGGLGDPVPVVRYMANDKVIFVAEFNMALKYIICFSPLFIEKDYPYTQTVNTFYWNYSMEQKVTENETHTVTISSGKSVSYVASVPTSGFYTLSMGNKEFHANMSSHSVFGSVIEYPQPISLGYWYDDERCQYVYYMEADTKYCVEIFYYDDGDFTGTFSLKKGDASGNYGTWKNGETKALTIEPHDNASMICKTFIMKAEEDGKYCLFSESFSGYIRGANGEQPEGQTFQDAYLNQGWVFVLKKGNYYIIDVRNYSADTKTDEITLQHYEDIQSGELKVIGFSGDQIRVGLFTDPPCAAYEGIIWSCSDPSIFEMNEYCSGVELYVKKQGSAVITAKIGDFIKSITVSTTYTPPAMQEGKTEYIVRESRSEVCAYFTPGISGKYSLSYVPDNAYEGIRYSIEIMDKDGCWTYQNIGFEKWEDAEIELKAGVEYAIYVSGSPAQLRFDLKSATPPPTEATQPNQTQPTTEATQPNQTQPSTEATQPAPTQPQTVTTTPAETKPTEPSEAPTQPAPTQPQTEATQPATEPSQPPETEPEQDTEPSTIPDESKPAEPVESKPTEPEGDDSTNSSPMIPMENVQIQNNSAYISSDAMEEILQSILQQELVLDLSNEENVTSVLLNAQALTAAVSGDRTLTVRFEDGLQLELSQEILNGFIKEVGEADVSLRACLVDPSQLNDSQRSALKDMEVNCVLNVDITGGEMAVHYLADKAVITLPLPDSGTDWQVYYISDDGTLEQMNTECMDDHTIRVYVDHFSSFALVRAQQASSAGGQWIVPAILLVVIAGGVVAFVILKKKGLLPCFVRK